MLKQIFSSKPVIFLEIAALIFFGFHVGKEFLRKRAIEKEVAVLEAEIERLEQKDDNLSSLLEYAKTDSFVESQARDKLNLVKPGESLVVIPNVDVDSENEDQSINNNGKILGESNIKLWWEYFFDYDQMWIE